MKQKKVFGTETTDYLDGFQCTNSILKFFPTTEGYFNVETGKYVYNYTDHLGNVRLSYAKNGPGTEIIEESNYYPFGLKHEGYNVLTGNPSYKYKYNGKELQESGMYDYGWRNYMPDVGRWTQLDPLVENTEDPYAYNNPISLTDPDGRAPYDGGDDDCCNEFFTGVKEGFVGTFKGIGNFIAHPIDGTKNAVNNYTWSDYGDSVANSMTFGIYGTAKTAGALIQGDSKTAGKITGEKAAEVIIVATTDGLGRGIKGIRNAKDPGLGNQFKTKTTSQVNNAMEKQVNKGKLDKVYTDPKSGSISYKNKKSGYSYNVDTGKSGKTGKKVEPAHIDVNYPNPKPKNMPPKKKLPTKED
ncbi:MULTISPECIES: RHS repeat domain-containing protein [unclassified Chryseobacterium]|uniref:RHS repeat domain-containing protein n=1 Tax=unclassified Chryseobacterium TaxID=2593645 RepID=UPI0027BA4809|nr:MULTISPECIES: RHS repeat-associated core domain-containing protein [unclassified Chryseobacterium]